jgi:hypothetical protein
MSIRSVFPFFCSLLFLERIIMSTSVVAAAVCSALLALFLGYQVWELNSANQGLARELEAQKTLVRAVLPMTDAWN